MLNRPVLLVVAWLFIVAPSVAPASETDAVLVVTVTPKDRSIQVSPWHVEVQPGTTILWKLEGAAVDIVARDGTVWCQLTAAEPSCQRSFWALGHHSYHARAVNPYDSVTALDVPPGPDAIYMREWAAINVLPDPGAVEILEFRDFTFNDQLAYQGTTDFVFVFDAWWPHGTLVGPGISCTFTQRGQFCAHTLSNIGTHAFRVEYRHEPTDAYPVIHPLDVQIRGTSPTIAFATPAAGAAVAGTFTVTGTASAQSGISHVDVKVAGQRWHPATGTTSWSIAVTDEGLRQGPIEVTARATSLDGQVVETTRTLDLSARGSADLAITQLVIGDWRNPDIFCLHFTCIANVAAFQYPFIWVDAKNLGSERVTSTFRLDYFEDGAWHTLVEEDWSIGPGARLAKEWYWVDALRLGNWILRATIDADDDFAETDEADNEKRRVARFAAATSTVAPNYNIVRTFEEAERRYNGSLVGQRAPSPGVAPRLDGGFFTEW